MKKIIYTSPNGALAVVHPSEGARLAHWITLADGVVVPAINPPQPVDTILRAWPVAGAVADWAETEEEFVARIAVKDVPERLSFFIVDAAAIPQDRTFRNAWEHDGNGGVRHNMIKARDLQRERLRVMRAPLLAALDVEYQRADETGDTAAKRRIVARKEELRAITEHAEIAAARTPEQLKTAALSIIGRAA